MKGIAIDGGEIQYEEDSWESEIVGKKVIKIKKLNGLNLENTIALLKDFESGLECGLVVSRISADDLISRQALESLNYSLIETYVTFMHPLGTIGGVGDVRTYTPADLEQVRRIARESFSDNRYHIDPLISDEIANKSREEWAVNSCNGRANIVLVPEVQGKVAGFSACNIKDSTGVIDLIAIDQSYRGKGIGTALVNASLKYFQEKGLENARVGTQANNIGAIRVYENCGFRLKSTELTYHKHF